MKQSTAIREALKKWYAMPREQAGSCQQFLKRLAEELAKEVK